MSYENLQQYLPKDKHDIESAKKIIELGFPTVQPILYEIFKWIQDLNWPVAQVLAPFLASIGKSTVPIIKDILNSNDAEWKYFTLISVVEKMSINDAPELKQELTNLANNPSEDDKYSGVDSIAKDLLSKFHLC